MYRQTPPLWHEEPPARITLTPLIDTSLVLLVIFMVATPLMEKHIRVDLPASHTADQRESAAAHAHVAVAVDAQGQCWIENEPVSIAQIKEIVLGRVYAGDLKGVTIVGDEKAPHAAVFAVLDTLQGLGLQYVTIAARTATK